MQERIEAVAELLASEHFEVERILRNVMVEFALRTEGEVTVIQIVEEVLTVVKQLRLKEEVKDQKKAFGLGIPGTSGASQQDLTVERSGVSKPG